MQGLRSPFSKSSESTGSQPPPLSSSSGVVLREALSASHSSSENAAGACLGRPLCSYGSPGAKCCCKLPTSSDVLLMHFPPGMAPRKVISASSQQVARQQQWRALVRLYAILRPEIAPAAEDAVLPFWLFRRVVLSCVYAS